MTEKVIKVLLETPLPLIISSDRLVNVKGEKNEFQNRRIIGQKFRTKKKFYNHKIKL
jgi:hypothetical protein